VYSTTSSDRENSDSEVSVDDDDDDDDGGSGGGYFEKDTDDGYAVVPRGPTAASRLRLIVASQEQRRARLEADNSWVDSQHHPGVYRYF